MHDVFHVGLLKQLIGEPPTSLPTLPQILHGQVIPTLEKVIKARLCRGVLQVLVQRLGQSGTDTSWKDVSDFKNRYPTVQLEDELFAEGGSDSCGDAITKDAAGSISPNRRTPQLHPIRHQPNRLSLSSLSSH